MKSQIKTAITLFARRLSLSSSDIIRMVPLSQTSSATAGTIRNYVRLNSEGAARNIMYCCFNVLRFHWKINIVVFIFSVMASARLILPGNTAGCLQSAAGWPYPHLQFLTG